MTQPPEQPTPAEPDPPDAQPPGPAAGNPTGSGEPPGRRSRAGMITAVVIAAVLVLGGGGTAVYLVTKDDATTTSSPGSPMNAPPTQASGSAPTSGGSAPSNPTGGEAPTSGSAPTSGGGGGGSGGGGGGSGSPQDDAQITEVAKKYAKAVTSKDESAAQSVTCAKDNGLLFTDDVKQIEVTGKPELVADDTASIGVKITLAEQEPIENFPLYMGKESNVWCIAN